MTLTPMVGKNASGDKEGQKKFQISIGEEIAWVEVVSIKEKIYSVELPGQQVLFITQITDRNNQTCWVSIPNGNNAVAEMVGYYIEKQIDDRPREG